MLTSPNETAPNIDHFGDAQPTFGSRLFGLVYVVPNLLVVNLGSCMSPHTKRYQGSVPQSIIIIISHIVVPFVPRTYIYPTIYVVKTAP
ncbi:hypothetical protein F5Y04DRAFT_68094 [Hypomontagnella monticulosa]|nr:hypothetical protein F5Y04DRAFT_68094 [Hypomontagnella monticulosa]